MSRRRKCKAKNTGKETLQSTLNSSTVDEAPNKNKSIPYGLCRAVKHYLGFVGLLDFLRKLKKQGKGMPRLDLIIVALIVHTLHDTNSMDACADWLKEPAVKRMIGFRHDEVINQKTIERAVIILGKNREGILEALWKGINSRFEINNYDIAIDGSSVVMYGPKSSYAKLGYLRDGRNGDIQVEFTVAVLTELGIPVYVRPFHGNVSDEAQYREAIPEVSSLVSDKPITSLDEYKQRALELGSLATMVKVGAMIIADNGAASKENIERAEKCGVDMLTRLKLNASDEKMIREQLSGFRRIPGLEVYCQEHTFNSSGRTNYLYFSPDLWKAALSKAENAIRRGLKDYKDYKDGKMSRAKMIRIRKIPGIEVEIKLNVSEIDLNAYSDEDIKRIARERIGPRAGFFKLGCTKHLTPEDALRRYRLRALVEQTISSLKRITGIKPLRVWGEMAIHGSMVLALLSESIISMVRYCAGKIYRRIDKRSGKKEKSYVPSTKTVVSELDHLTLSHFINENRHYDSQLSNWSPLTEAIFTNIHDHESPEWGSQKVPLSSEA